MLPDRVIQAPWARPLTQTSHLESKLLKFFIHHYSLLPNIC